MLQRTVLKQVLILACLVGGGVVFLLSTNPSHLPLPLLVVPFIWMFVVLFYAAWVFGAYVTALQGRRRRLIVAGFCSTLPVLLAVFESIHQLTVRDVILAVAIVVVVAFYIGRADFIK